MVMMIITTSLVNVVQSVGGLRQTKITCCLLPSSLPGPPRIIIIIITIIIAIIIFNIIIIIIIILLPSSMPGHPRVIAIIITVVINIISNIKGGGGQRFFNNVQKNCRSGIVGHPLSLSSNPACLLGYLQSAITLITIIIAIIFISIISTSNFIIIIL